MEQLLEKIKKVFMAKEVTIAALIISWSNPMAIIFSKNHTKIVAALWSISVIVLGIQNVIRAFVFFKNKRQEKIDSRDENVPKLSESCRAQKYAEKLVKKIEDDNVAYADVKNEIIGMIAEERTLIYTLDRKLGEYQTLANIYQNMTGVLSLTIKRIAVDGQALPDPWEIESDFSFKDGKIGDVVLSDAVLKLRERAESAEKKLRENGIEV